jgi:hypothetical protein
VAEELAEVDVNDGAQHQHKLVLCREFALQVAWLRYIEAAAAAAAAQAQH